MKRKEINIKKVLLLIFALLFVVQINFLDTSAANKSPVGLTSTSTGWSVSKNSNWSKKVTATGTTTYFSVTSFSSDYEYAMLAMKTAGAWTMVTKTVSKIATASVKKGSAFTAQAQVSNPQYLEYLNASGKFYY